ncbi:MAG: phosphorylase [Methylovulum sp.]|nr:phosphorylase [Methylovulum sp.]
MITGIVVALPEELTTLTSKRIDKGHCVFIADKLLVAYSGAGAKNATAAAELLINKGATQLISWGCAAALDASLKPGDLALADNLIDVDDTEIAINSNWHEYANNLLAPYIKIHTGSLTQSANIISSSKEKLHLQIITEAIALDMESIAVAKAATKKNLPFLAIRAIVDPADMDMPRAVSYAANAEGDIILSRLLLFIALHPAELPGLIRLGLYFNAAKSTLKRVAKQLDALIHFPNMTQ